MNEVRFRAVVVDDEPAARDAVLTFLADFDAITVVGEGATAGEAIDIVRNTRPDLLFLDIQMPDRNGFEVLEELGRDVPPGVVLVTAHGEYAQRAFDVHAVDYVTKPFGRPRFVAAVNRALHRLAAEEALDVRTTLDSLISSLRLDERTSEGEDLVGAMSPEEDSREGVDPDPGPDLRSRRIGVRLGNRTTLVEIDEIDWIEADGELVRVHVADRVHLLQSRMRDLEERLSGSRFVRIHRSVIVNLDRVKVLHREPDGGGSVGLSTGVEVRVARSRWETLEAALGLRPPS